MQGTVMAFPDMWFCSKQTMVTLAYIKLPYKLGKVLVILLESSHKVSSCSTAKSQDV